MPTAFSPSSAPPTTDQPYGLNPSVSDQSIAQFRTPAQLCLIAEAAGWGKTPPGDRLNPASWGSPTGNAHWQVAWPGSPQYEGTGCGDCTRRPYAVHNEGLNVGYADGHVKWLKGTNVVNDATLWTP